MIYICKYCDYKTDIRQYYERHNTSKKHLKNIETNENCGEDTEIDVSKLAKKIGKLEFQKKLIKQSLELELEYEKKLAKEKEQLAKEKEELNNEKHQLEQKMLKEKDEIRVDHTNYLKGLVVQAGNIVTTSISTISFLKTNYNTAPVLLEIPDYKKIQYNDSKPIEDVLLYNFKYKKVEDVVCLILVNHYKKLNPREQSTWNTDPERKTYIVRSMVNNQPDWVTDKKGEKLKALAVDPLVNYLKKLIGKRIELISKLEDNPAKATQMEIAAGLIKAMEDNRFASNVIGKMAPFLYLDQATKSASQIQLQPDGLAGDDLQNTIEMEKLDIDKLDINENIVNEIIGVIMEDSIEERNTNLPFSQPEKVEENEKPDDSYLDIEIALSGEKPSVTPAAKLNRKKPGPKPKPVPKIDLDRQKQLNYEKKKERLLRSNQKIMKTF